MKTMSWLCVVATLACGGLAQAQTPAPFRVTSGFGHDGCSGNTGFDVNGTTTVHAEQAVTCFSGFGSVRATAGPGFLNPAASATHTGFGTGTGLGSIAEFHVPFVLTSSVDETVPVSLNLVMAIILADEQPTSAALSNWTARMRTSVDGGQFMGGSRTADGAFGFPPPEADGLPHAFTSNTVMITTNTPHTLDFELEASVGSIKFQVPISVETTLTLSGSGPVFNLPAGVVLEDIPLLNVVANHWTDPRVPPSQDFIIEDATPQSDLDALSEVIGNVVMEGTGRADLTLPNLESVGCSFRVTDNPNLTSLVVPSLAFVGCDLTVARNPALQQVSLTAGTGVGGNVTIEDNGNAPIQLHTPHIGGNATFSGRGPSVDAVTGDGTTTVTMSNPPLKMSALVPPGSFAQDVPFSILSLGAELPSDGLDAGGTAVTIGPLGAYRFSFGIPTLNLDATLTFDVDVTALDAAGATDFLDALASDRATLALRADAPGSVYQAFEVCDAAQEPTAGGCVRVERFDAAGAPLPPGDPTVPATVRFTGLTAHFSSSSFAVVIVNPLDTTPPVISGVPGDITVAAVGPTGTRVIYTAPTALDDRDGAVGVGCTPPNGFTFPIGATTVTCTASDSAGNTATARFTVTILHSTPKANPDAFSVSEDALGVLLDVLANDVNPDGDPLIVTVLGQASHGTVGLSPAGVTYTPAPDYSGPDSFAYSTGDGFGGTATATVSLTVIAVNDAPVNAVPGPQTTPLNRPLVFSKAGGNPVSVGDVDGESLRITLKASNGTLTLGSRSGLAFLSGDGTADAAMSFTGAIASVNDALEGMFLRPRPGFGGVVTVTITSDDQGNSGTGGPLADVDAVAVTVGPRADLAIAMTDAPDPATAGADLTYAIRVTNHGPFAATGVNVLDNLPASVTVVSASASQGACNVVTASGNVRCNLGALADQGAATVTIVVRPSRRATISNQALVGANQLDPNLTNNFAAAQTVVR